MIKFKTDEDKIRFFIEANRPDLITQNVDDKQILELLQGIIKRRSLLKKRLKDKKRSQIQKQNWKKYRTKYLLAIRQFHRSVDGKRFHRNLARFLATRFPRSESYFLSPVERYEFLKLLSSFKTHFYIEGVYYKPLTEEIEYELFIEEVIPLIDEIEKKVLTQNKLDKEDFEFLLDILTGCQYETIDEVICQFKES